MALAELLFGRKDESFWEDREIRFDAPTSQLECRPGETVIEALDPVEDTKGNNGEPGELLITNLRLIWVSKKSKRTNISIGYNCVTNLQIKTASSRLKGDTQALYVLTKFHQQRFEFIFTNLQKTMGHLFNVVQAVYKAYDNSRLYRDIKLRGALIVDRELRVLPQEQTFSRVNGVWNVSSEQGNLGTFFISNVRLVWYANLADTFNISIPYLQMQSIKVRDSKFGQALVIETTPWSGGYVLGFKVDPKETLDYVYKEITSLQQAYLKQPVYGVQFDIQSVERQAAALKALKLASTEEDVAVIDPVGREDVLASYYAEPAQGGNKTLVYCPELGLAIEQLKEGMTIEQLWNVL